MEIALRILDLALDKRKYELQQVTATEQGTTKLNPNELAVSVMMEARTEDTDFAVSVTSDTEGHEYSEANSSFCGTTSAGLDVYKSHEAKIHTGFISIELSGTPSPSFLFSYLKATLLE